MDGKGSVDVALEHDQLTIAVEISISTDIRHEMANVQKGFEAGFDHVVLIVPQADKRARASEQINAVLTKTQSAMFHALSAEEFSALLNEQAAKLSTTEQTLLGYRVTTNFKPVSPEEAEAKRKLIAKIIAQSKGRPPKNDE
ncbi:hypothetical protein [Maricaulis sp.]|uniref:hypothetical protein n=1 Tax=Maricaulis sp. TaxID=1486257 RepID=UPI003A90F1D6